MARIFYGWWIVLATSVIHTWGAGTFFYSFTAFFNPIVNEFGWSYTATSIAASLRVIEGGIASPLIGFAADRYGSRRLIIAGSIFSGFGFILFSGISSLWSFYFVFVFLSIGASLLFPIAGWTAVANWFDKKRGVALGILSGATGTGGILIYLINWLVEVYGWRPALLIVGVGFWVFTIPCAIVVRHDPESLNLRPDGENQSGDSADRAKAPSATPTHKPDGFTLSQVLKTRAFWNLAAIVTLSGTALHSVTVHIMPYFISIDLNRAEASLIASLLVVVSVLGRFGVGWLSSGRMDCQKLLTLALLMQALGLVIMVWADTFSKAVLFVVTFGPAFGALITLRLTVQGEFFGRKAYGSIQGFIMTLMVLGSMSGPVLTGFVYDQYKTYSPAWLAMALLSLLGIPLALTLRPPQNPVGTGAQTLKTVKEAD